MEEPMSPGVEEANEGSSEVRDPVDEPTASLDAVEVVPESGQGVVHDMAAPAADTARPDMRALKGILEALLFVTAEPIPVTRFLALLGAVTKQDVDQALASLAQDYEQEGRGLQLAEVAGGYRIVTKAEFAPWLKR